MPILPFFSQKNGRIGNDYFFMAYYKIALNIKLNKAIQKSTQDISPEVEK